jgi:hypothetical protein
LYQTKYEAVLKLLHLFTALNILLSSTGVMAFEHLCKLRGRSISLYLPPKSCCKHESSAVLTYQSTDAGASLNAPGLSFKTTPCCSDQSQYFKALLEGGSSSSSVLDFELLALPIIGLPAYQTAFSQHLVPFSEKNLRFYLYKPPALATDIRVLIRSFLC